MDETVNNTNTSTFSNKEGSYKKSSYKKQL